MKILILLVFYCFISISYLAAQAKEESKVATAVERLRAAMVNADKTELEDLTSAHLSYGHSGGEVDDKETFVSKNVTAKLYFDSLKLTEQTIKINKTVAIVRHHFFAVVNENNQKKEVSLLVLQIWQKENRRWKLLVRQAVKKS
jgi:uncharacterized membrane protein